jgi:hypothetical protein
VPVEGAWQGRGDVWGDWGWEQFGVQPPLVVWCGVVLLPAVGEGVDR